MKKTLLSILVAFMVIAANAQSTVGLLAHWDMNGEVNDVSGNGHNGHANNLVADTGMGGVPNTAYYFNGSNSYITVPYSADLNLTQFSICAVLNAEGFYSGGCHVNTVFTRGSIGTPGNYSLYFYDVPYTLTCSSFDTTKDVFVPSAGGHSMPGTAWQYTPTTVENKWYKVVATWDGTQWQVFVNDTLKVTNVSTGGVFGTSTDSISIGMDIFAPGNPYYFKGIIDDILLYNRVLTDSEISHLTDTCGSITLQPVASYLGSSGGTTTYTISSSITGAAYQWQGNSGTGFVNLSNAGPYSGVTTPTLTVVGSSSMTHDLYRCLVSNSWGCADTSASAILTVGLDNVHNNEMVTLYPNPARSEITITAPDKINTIAISNLLGQVVYFREYDAAQVRVNVAHLPEGVYFVKINGFLARKFLKE